eukprot:130773_1
MGTHVCADYVACVYGLVWVALVWLIIVPFEIYVTIRMVQYSHHPGVASRYPFMVIAFAVFAMFHSIICDQFLYLSIGLNIDLLQKPSIRHITCIILPTTLLVVLTLIIFRSYLIHYNIKYTVNLSTCQWQSLLSDTVSTNDFYVRHRTTYGNWKYVLRYFIGYIIVGSLIGISLTVPSHSELFYAFWNLILIVFGVILFAKTPNFDDAYFMRTEMKYLWCFHLHCIVLYIAMFVLIFVFDDAYPIFHSIQTSAITLFNFGGVVISEHVILNKIKQKDRSAFESKLLKPATPNTVQQKISVVMSRVSFHQQKHVHVVGSRQLFNVLIASPVGINFYVTHLQSEFCLENLLAFIELTQWLYNVTNRDFDMFDILPLPGINFEFNSAIPTSSANQKKMNSQDDEWDWEQSILLIFKKYIHSSADYQVNLPYQIQNNFVHFTNLLTIKHQLEKGSYRFRHGSQSMATKRKNHFWTKPTSTKVTPAEKDNRNAMNRSFIMDYNIRVMPLSATATAGTVSAYSPTPVSAKTIKPFSNVSISSVHTSAVTPLPRINDCKVSADDRPRDDHNDEFIIVNADYLYGDKYNDPEIDHEDHSAVATKSTLTPNTDDCDEIKRGETEVEITMIETISIPGKHVQLNALQHSLRKMSSWMGRLSNSNPENILKQSFSKQDKRTEEYLKEVKMIEQAKTLSVFEFVSLVCGTLHTVLQLNYQSVTRFKRSAQYIQMKDAINLEEMIRKYGDKGVPRIVIK